MRYYRPMRPIDTLSGCPDYHRRKFLQNALAGSAAFFTVPGALAEALTRGGAAVLFAETQTTVAGGVG